MTSPPAVLLGSQEPTRLVLPPRVGSAGAEAVELARSAGLILDPWQATTLDAALSEQPGGQWAAFEVGVVVPRQNGKGAILEARELAGLFLLGEELILHSAHEFKTGQEAFRRVLNLIENTPDLDRKVKRVRTSHGEEGIETTTGARLRFVARSSGSGRGFSGDCIILDEAFRVSPAMMAALLPTLMARPNPQIWYTTSSPFELDEHSEQIRSVKARADSDDPGRLAWVEWSNPRDVDPSDRDAWARANPALGTRISEEMIEAAYSTLPLEVFLVENLGVWKAQSVSAKIPEHAWAATTVDVSPSMESPVFAVDIPPDRSAGSVAVCSRDDIDGDSFTAELADRRRGTEWLVPRLIELSDRYGAPVVIDAAGPAYSLVDDLEKAGVPVHVTATRDFTAACSRLFDGVRNGTFGHPAQPALDAAVLGASDRRVGDAWAWSRTSSSVDISPLVAVTLALWGASTIEVVEELPAPVFAY